MRRRRRYLSGSALLLAVLSIGACGEGGKGASAADPFEHETVATVVPPGAEVTSSAATPACSSAREDGWGEHITEFQTDQDSSKVKSFYDGELSRAGWREADASEYGTGTWLYLKRVDEAGAQIRVLEYPTPGRFGILAEYPPPKDC